jgi:hypothetical protein
VVELPGMAAVRLSPHRRLKSVIAALR